MRLFVEDVVQHITTDGSVSTEVFDRIHIYLEESRSRADEELERLWDDNSHQPITYNHYYTDNIQNARANATRYRIKQAMHNASVGVYNGKLHISNTVADAEKLLHALQRQVSVDMEEQACSEVLAGFSAYYKVSASDFLLCRLLSMAGGQEDIRRQHLYPGRGATHSTRPSRSIFARIRGGIHG